MNTCCEDDVFGQFIPRVLHYGTYAEYVVTSASGAVAPKPVSLDYVQAAALPMPAQTALASEEENLNPTLRQLTAWPLG